jgi:ferredoxin
MPDDRGSIEEASLSAAWSVTLDESRCTRSGLCAGTAPEHFSFDPSGATRPNSELVLGNESVLDAARCCPTEAITVTDVATGRQLAPEEDDALPMPSHAAGLPVEETLCVHAVVSRQVHSPTRDERDD